ncbi:PQQ-dependent sugar dehydrogenase [Anaerocolumna aminovalerica]|uniref:Glucose/arabinose dehydrogenase, beta-propeller fold n=1 Tax=Anaerocolumna aminovalerica TaxID=1527 RepID=A0A1I5DI86_9FIRM|nr:PQQ-dependent sugar dehydrogenase [Anaerocolumna aminovalerica]SFN98974.1 Glucose/arabinose dehydrogenase, beta-propeller fold [Anaerocolumna aminovalerica]
MGKKLYPTMLRYHYNQISGQPFQEFPYEIDIIAVDLYVPWALDLSPDGNIYFTERDGNVRKIQNGMPLDQPLITLPPPFSSQGEGGLMGIALDPDFSQNHYLYIMYTYIESNEIFNRVARLVEENNKATLNQVILDRIPGGRIHNGGRIKIGPDQRLYITTGDVGNPSLAQDLSSLAGKILRINLDGSIPEDNPFIDSPIYSYGHRNPQGLTWSDKGILYSTEHGETAHDEVNIIFPGANYGWPLVEGYDVLSDLQIQRPLIQSGDVTWAPSGIAYINQGPWAGKLLIACLRGEQLLLLSLDENGTSVTAVEPLLENEYGRLREVVQWIDGSVYVTTSNMDGRGILRPGDDKILCFTPKL